MTHTSTEQPEALRLAEHLEQFRSFPALAAAAAAELRRLHAESELHLQELRSYRITVENREARIAELEAQTAHMADLVELADYATKKLEASQARVPLSDEEIFNIYCQSDSELSTTAKNLTLFVRDIEAAHGITQEKQG